MQIRNILNRELVNLQNCDQEPIHIPGSIQPHGCLFGVHRTKGTIDYASDNSGKVIALPLLSLLGTRFSEHFTVVREDKIGSVITRVRVIVNKQEFECRVHASGDYDLFEIEFVSEEANTPDLLELSTEFVTYIENTTTIEELCSVVAGGIRKITGYDRVMIYRFDENYNGEVIAEAKNEELEAFLGLHYPNTDIPVQARTLYLKNQLRMICDVHYEPVPIYTLLPESVAPLDLGQSQLRSVSPIHCQYLKNMGVGATLTISLVNKGKLWGLVACHHYSPRHLSYAVRMAAKLTGHLITSQIETRLTSEENRVYYTSNQAIQHLFTGIKDFSENSLVHLFSSAEILTVCNANGAVLLFNNRVHSVGQIPQVELVKKCVDELELRGSSELRSNRLSEILPSLPALTGEFPGLLYFPLSGKGEAMLWFRKETFSEVHWAGDPARAIEKDKNGLSPRKSFALWKEMVTGQSKAWLVPEYEAASRFIGQLEKQLNAITLSLKEEKQRHLAIALKETNEELENINWISTHDLQEPLRKIQMLASLLLDDERKDNETERIEKIKKMDHLASRMRNLITDIIQYNKLGHGNRVTEIINLEKMLDELAPEIRDLSDDTELIVKGPLPPVVGTPWLLRQLFVNLINNSFRFRKENSPARITIDEVAYEESPQPPDSNQYVIIRYADSGIGFDPKHNEHVFRIFSRLSEARSSEGSGIGLALCRKVMQQHRGHIKAVGKPGIGVEFYLYFPAIS